MNIPNQFSNKCSSVLSLAVAAGVLVICLLYTLGNVYFVPGPGFSLDSQMRIVQLDESCEADRNDSEIAAWCADAARQLQLGDQIEAIITPENNEIFTRDQYQSDPLRVPFFGLEGGDRVLLDINRAGERLEIAWTIRGNTLRKQLFDLGLSLLFLPFWLAGTAVLLFVRPRNTRWYLLVVFNYLTALWFVVGVVSTSRIFGSSLLVALLSWLLMPVYLHFHLLLPTPLLGQRNQRWIFLIYVVALVLGLLSIFGPLPRTIYYFGLLVGMGGSLTILLLRSVHPTAFGNRSATNLMLVGLAVPILPAILWLSLAVRGGSEPLNNTVAVLLMLALPALPLSYTYALYKHRLGDVEVRANRALALYSFTVIYATLFVILFVLFYRQPEFNAPALGAALAASVICLAFALIVWNPLKRCLNRIAYGTIYEPEQLIRHFANEISRALNREHLATLLTIQVMPTLLVRQSALFWLTAPDPLIYSHHVPAEALTRPTSEVTSLLNAAETFLIGEECLPPPFDWVRLVIPIRVDGRAIGVWLLGRRDPDDFYPQSDIDLLSTLGSQIAVALETTRLFEIVQQRTNELERLNFELRRAQKLKDDLLRNITHELRTPLTTIYGYTDLLALGEGGSVTDEQREMLQIITKSTEELSSLVNDIIALQQTKVSNVEGMPTKIDEVAQKSIQNAQILARKEAHWRRQPHNILMRSDDEPPYYVWGNPAQLGQVFDNLLQNAVKFSPNGGRITVRLWKDKHRFATSGKPEGAGDASESGSSEVPAIFISVRDEGIGIPSDELENVWLDFYQIDSSATRHFGGTGIGLALVKDIVEMHGGTIWAESKEGQGSTFTFVLPQFSATQPSAEDSRSTASRSTTARSNHLRSQGEDVDVTVCAPNQSSAQHQDLTVR